MYFYFLKIKWVIKETHALIFIYAENIHIILNVFQQIGQFTQR